MNKCAPVIIKRGYPDRYFGYLDKRAGSDFTAEGMGNDSLRYSRANRCGCRYFPEERIEQQHHLFIFNITSDHRITPLIATIQPITNFNLHHPSLDLPGRHSTVLLMPRVVRIFSSKCFCILCLVVAIATTNNC